MEYIGESVRIFAFVGDSGKKKSEWKKNTSDLYTLNKFLGEILVIIFIPKGLSLKIKQNFSARITKTFL